MEIDYHIMMNQNLLLFLLFMSILGSATSLRLQELKEVLEPTLVFADGEFNDHGLSLFGPQPTHLENNGQQPTHMGPVLQEGVPKCMISSRGSDGFGHQFHAKLSCMAVAETLGMKYIHTPFKNAEHGEAGSSFNDYLGLDKIFPVLKSITNVSEQIREPVPRMGDCEESTPSWFRDLANGRRQCAHDGKSVYTADNCWDFFYCHSVSWADQWYNKVQPRVREAFLESSKAYSVDMEKRGPNDKRVVLHIRRGDIPKQRTLQNEYYHNVIDMLKEEFEKDGNHVTFHMETDGYKKEFQSFTDKGVIVEDRTSSLKSAFRRMVTADVFVASRSSFSEAAAMLSSGQVIWPECNSALPAKDSPRRAGMHLPPTWRVHPCN